VLPLLSATGANLLMLEEAVVEQLESEGCALVKMVTEHVLTCFQSRDP
jgi:hypothetical protein